MVQFESMACQAASPRFSNLKASDRCLPHVNRSVSRAFDQIDRVLAVRLAPIALARCGDNAVIGGLQMPPPLPNVVFVDHVIHIVVDCNGRALQSRGEN